MKTSLRLQTPWEEVKEKLKEVNTDLTDDDLQYQPGDEDALLKRLAGKLHQEPAQVKSFIESISANEGKAS